MDLARVSVATVVDGRPPYADEAVHVFAFGAFGLPRTSTRA